MFLRLLLAQCLISSLFSASLLYRDEYKNTLFMNLQTGYEELLAHSQGTYKSSTEIFVFQDDYGDLIVRDYQTGRVFRAGQTHGSFDVDSHYVVFIDRFGDLYYADARAAWVEPIARRVSHYSLNQNHIVFRDEMGWLVIYSLKTHRREVIDYNPLSFLAGEKAVVFQDASHRIIGFDLKTGMKYLIDARGDNLQIAGDWLAYKGSFGRFITYNLLTHQRNESTVGVSRFLLTPKMLVYRQGIAELVVRNLESGVEKVLQATHGNWDANDDRVAYRNMLGVHVYHLGSDQETILDAYVREFKLSKSAVAYKTLTGLLEVFTFKDGIKRPISRGVSEYEIIETNVTHSKKRKFRNLYDF